MFETTTSSSAAEVDLVYQFPFSLTDSPKELMADFQLQVLVLAVSLEAEVELGQQLAEVLFSLAEVAPWILAEVVPWMPGEVVQRGCYMFLLLVAWEELEVLLLQEEVLVLFGIQCRMSYYYYSISILQAERVSAGEELGCQILGRHVVLEVPLVEVS